MRRGFSGTSISECGLPLAPGMEISYVAKDARMWEVDPERTASEFDPSYYGGRLEKAWTEVGFVFFRDKIMN